MFGDLREIGVALAAVLLLVGGFAGKLGQVFERRRAGADPPESPCIGPEMLRRQDETRDLILAVKEGDRALLREMREAFSAEMRELRSMEARQNELLAGLVARGFDPVGHHAGRGGP